MSFKQLSKVAVLIGVFSLFVGSSMSMGEKEKEVIGAERPFQNFILDNRDAINKQFETIRKSSPELATVFTTLYIDYLNQGFDPRVPPVKEICFGPPSGPGFPDLIPPHCIDLGALRQAVEELKCLPLNNYLGEYVIGSTISGTCGLIPLPELRVRACNLLSTRAIEAKAIREDPNSTVTEIIAAANDFAAAYGEWLGDNCQDTPSVEIFPDHDKVCNNWVDQAETAVGVFASGASSAQEIVDAVDSYDEAKVEYDAGGCGNFLAQGVNVFPT